MRPKSVSLYECMNARYPNTEPYIYCSKGHKLGFVNPLMAERGQPLNFKICQGCHDLDFNKMEHPLEVGWTKKKMESLNNS